MGRGRWTKKRTDSVKSPESVEECALPVRLLVCGFVIILVAFAGFSWYSWRSYTKFIAADGERHRLVELNGTIVHLDEVLTMSARMAATTGDPRWEERFRGFEPELDAAIEEAKALAPPDLVGLAQSVAQTDKANLKLVAMENEAFDLVRRGNLQAALALLDSQEYTEQKVTYAQEMDRYIRLLSESVKAHVHTQQQRTVVRVALAGLLVLIATLAGVGALQVCSNFSVRRQADLSVRLSYEELKNNDPPKGYDES